MSKWISKELFEGFRKEKMEEKETPTVNFNRSELVWQNPQMGTVDTPKVYEGRFLQDSKGNFYKKYYYHMWKSGENWIFVLCPKTHDFKNFCPFCSAVNKLYAGTKQDKAHAYNVKRKERFVCNFYIEKDPRDNDRDDEDKIVGKVRLYEFPSSIEKKVKKEITDKDQGYGLEIFDPSENGRNFIISVLSTKKDESGKQWPDYSPSEFSRRQSALGTEQEIDNLMETCVDINEYINNMETDKDKQVEILKNEFLWDLVETDCLKNGYVDDDNSFNSAGGNDTREERQSETRNEEPDNQREENTEENTEENNQESDSVDDDLNDDDLLAELDSL